MDRAELAMACVEVEKAGGSVREFLAEQGCISPWGTWYRLQKEELHRRDSQITDGKGRVNMARKITLEQKKKVVQIAIEGGDPLEYLRQLGSKNPSGLWWTIKNDVKAADPELYAKIPRLDGKQQHIIPPEEREAKREEIRKEAEKRGLVQEEKHNILPGLPEKAQMELGLMDEMVNTTSDDLPKIPDGEEKQEITKPVGYFPKFVEPVLPMDLQQMLPRFTVTSVRGKFGEWHLDEKHNSLDFRGAEGEEICFRPEAWFDFMVEIRAVMQILGVKIDKNEDKTA